MKRISTSIDIAAPAARVWAVLTDFARYPEWNPFIRRIVGSPATGTRLQVTIEPAGGRAMSFLPEVIVCEPERELRWLGRVLVRGVFDGEHSFRLAPLTPGSCGFVHEERFSGILASLIMRGDMEARTRAGFDAMNRALKARVEREATVQ
jgi:hypothetical protein